MIPTITEALDLLKSHTPFALDNGRIDRTRAQPLIDIAETFANLAQTRMAELHDIVPHEEREQLRYITDIASCALKQVPDSPRKQAISHSLFASKLGLSPEALVDGSDYQRFILKNHLHHKNQSVGLILGDQMAIKIAGIGIVPWADLVREETNTGYTFFYQNNEVFRTNAELELPSHAYIYTVDGIVHQDPRSSHVNRFDHDDAHMGRYTVEVWTMLDSTKIPSACFGCNHAWLALKDAQGDIFTVGRSGPRKMSLLDALSPFGKKLGGIETPDYGSQLPRDAAHYQKVSFDLTQVQFETLMTRISHDKEHNRTHLVAMLQSNCTSYVKELLNLVGIEPETRIHPMALLSLNLLPKALGEPIAAVFHFSEDRPWWQYALHFFPPIYVIDLVFGLIMKLFSLFNDGGCGADLSLVDVFLKPWKIYVDHPHRLAKWQQTQGQIDV